LTCAFPVERGPPAVTLRPGDRAYSALYWLHVPEVPPCSERGLPAGHPARRDRADPGPVRLRRLRERRARPAPLPAQRNLTVLREQCGGSAGAEAKAESHVHVSCRSPARPSSSTSCSRSLRCCGEAAQRNLRVPGDRCLMSLSTSRRPPLIP